MNKALPWLAIFVVFLPACSFLHDRSPTYAGKAAGTAAPTKIHQARYPPSFTFQELVQLSSTSAPTGELGRKLHIILTNPSVNNEPYYRGIKPRRPDHPKLGPILRAAQWNVERGINFDWILAAFTNKEEFLARLRNDSNADVEEIPEVHNQLQALSDIDLLVVNEVDIGMGRTDYRDVAQELAKAMDMNYAFGVEFVEVDKLYLGLEKITIEDTELAEKLYGKSEPDPVRHKGLHGTAILSHYPISNVQIKRLSDCYDWYNKETKAISDLEKGKRKVAKEIFLERVAREVRHGGRMVLLANIAVPELPTGYATVVATHLETKCPPKCRRKQIEEILGWIRNVRNPVILAGDFNTTGTDSAPTSVRREIRKRLKSPTFWLKQVFNYLNPITFYRIFELPARYFKNYQDPTSVNVPVFAPNPEAKLFKRIKHFRFPQGYAFDFRGEKNRTLEGREDTLADSNQRAPKGFKPTFEFEKDYKGLIGHFKIDWFFIKPFITDPDDSNGAYFFAPHFPQVLDELTKAPGDRISDHFPITVDLPLQEPPSL